MARGKKTPDDVRAAIMAALLAGQGVSETAETFQIPQQTVSDLKKLIDPYLERIGRGSVQKLEIGEKVLNVLDTQLQALQAIAEGIKAASYIEKQPASEIAVLYGVIADKAFRILSALEPEPQPTGTTGESEAANLPN